MINLNVAHLDKTLFFSCSWQKVDIQVGKYSECVTIIPDDLTGVTYWLCFHIGTQTTLQMIVTEEKNPYSILQRIKGTSVRFLRTIPINVHNVPGDRKAALMRRMSNASACCASVAKQWIKHNTVSG